MSGLGLGHSREIWGLLPNPQTDFIFSIIGEELGVIGTFAVIALFIAFLFVAVRIARQCSNQVYRLIAVGIATWIIVEALLNIASVVGWWAVTGVPLPFFSYGGTALITELAADRRALQHRPRPHALERPHDSSAHPGRLDRPRVPHRARAHVGPGVLNLAQRAANLRESSRRASSRGADTTRAAIRTVPSGSNGPPRRHHWGRHRGTRLSHAGDRRGPAGTRRRRQ